jgi:hypothetical protein
VNDSTDLRTLPNRIFQPGEKADRPGMYQVTHEIGGCPADAVFIAAGDVFPACDACRNTVYRLVMPDDGHSASAVRRFFTDLEQAFCRHFGREMSYEEGWFFDLAERSVADAEREQQGKRRA